MPNAPSSSTAPSAASATPGAPVQWLGMQIESLPPATVVVATVSPGSAGEAAGIDPGDFLTEINGKPVSTTSEIIQATSGLQRGDSVVIQLSRGSTVLTTRATLTAPASHP